MKVNTFFDEAVRHLYLSLSVIPTTTVTAYALHKMASDPTSPLNKPAPYLSPDVQIITVAVAFAVAVSIVYFAMHCAVRFAVMLALLFYSGVWFLLKKARPELFVPLRQRALYPVLYLTMISNFDFVDGTND